MSIGKWWSREEEIDIVALDEETNTACFGECKWSSRKVGEDIYQELVRKSRLVDRQSEKKNVQYILFSKSGFTKKMLELGKAENVLMVHKDRVVP